MTDLLRIAEITAASSRDPSTKTGCVIARPDSTVIGRGFNGPPGDVVLTKDQAGHRPTRLLMTVHAEARALLSCSPRGTVGVSMVVAPAPNNAMLERWGESMEVAYEIALLAGMKVDLLESIKDE